MADFEIQIPGGSINNARWDLDTHMIPSIFYKDSADFIIRCRRHSDGYLCALFNRYYEIANRVFFLDDPKHFEKAQFSLTEHNPEHGGQVIRLSLPDEHKGSLNYCTDYVITYDKKLFGPQNAKFFTIERHFGGVYRLGTVDASGNHTDLGESTGTAEDDVAQLCRIAAEQDAQRAEQARQAKLEKKNKKKK